MLTIFCESCDNLMDIKWHNEDPHNETNNEKYMILYCNKCGNTDILKKQDFYEVGVEEQEINVEIQEKKYSPLIYKKNYENSQIDSRLFNNEFIIHDKTLPFVNDVKIKCPKCSHKKESYIKFMIVII